MAVLILLGYLHVASGASGPPAASAAPAAVMVILVGLLSAIIGGVCPRGTSIGRVVDIHALIGVEHRPFFTKYHIIG